MKTKWQLSLFIKEVSYYTNHYYKNNEIKLILFNCKKALHLYKKIVKI